MVNNINARIFELAIIFLSVIESFNVIDLPSPCRTLSFNIFLFGMFIWVITIRCKIRIFLPNKAIMRSMLLLLLSFLLSAVIHIEDLFNMKFQGEYAIYRFILEYGLYIVNLCMIIYMYNILLNLEKPLKVFHKYIIISFIIASVYGFIELGKYMGNINFSDLLNMIDLFIRKNNEVDFYNYFRIRSLTKEPSNFAIYSVILLPWLFAGLLIFKKKILIILLIAAFYILNVFSFSRTGYFTLIFETVMILFLFYRQLKKVINYLLWLLVFLFVLLSVIFYMNSDLILSVNIIDIFESLVNNDMLANESNMARFASQMASCAMFIDYPVTGCGFAQYPFYAMNYYPTWSWGNIEIINWGINYTNKVQWAPAFNIYFRMLAETGIIGFICFVFFWTNNLYRLIRINVSEKNFDDYIYRKCLICSIIGSFISFLSTSEVMLIEWIMLPLSWCIVKKYEVLS